MRASTGALGAEITGIDLESPSRGELKRIRELLVQHQVLFFRGQNITRAAHKALAESFGGVQSHPAYDTVSGFPEIAVLESTAEKPTKIECWHSDMTFRQTPPMATCLRSRIVPDRGGDTLWSSMTAAFDALSAALQDFLSGLTAVHSFEHGFRESLAEPGGRERLAGALQDNPPVEHPIVATHPESGHRILFVNQLFTTHIVGLKPVESDAVLNMLFRHIETPEFSCRFRWQANDIALWDNRSTQHKPVNDYFPAVRQLERITIDGDFPLQGLPRSE